MKTERDGHIQTEEEDTLKDKYLTFEIADLSYAIPVKSVREIAGRFPVTKVPELPPYMLGIINLRGEIIPVMDVRVRIGEIAKDFDERTSTIVIQAGGEAVGLIVDRVSEFVTIDGGSISPAPEAGGFADYIYAVGKISDNIKLIIDCEKLLGEMVLK